MCICGSPFFLGSTVNMVTPFVFAVLTLDQADAEARKMISDESVVEFYSHGRRPAGRIGFMTANCLPRRTPSRPMTMWGLQESGQTDK
jgi:hypothetical protein